MSKSFGNRRGDRFVGKRLSSKYGIEYLSLIGHGERRVERWISEDRASTDSVEELEKKLNSERNKESDPTSEPSSNFERFSDYTLNTRGYMRVDSVDTSNYGILMMTEQGRDYLRGKSAFTNEDYFSKEVENIRRENERIAPLRPTDEWNPIKVREKIVDKSGETFYKVLGTNGVERWLNFDEMDVALHIIEEYDNKLGTAKIKYSWDGVIPSRAVAASVEGEHKKYRELSKKQPVAIKSNISANDESGANPVTSGNKSEVDNRMEKSGDQGNANTTGGTGHKTTTNQHFKELRPNSAAHTVGHGNISKGSHNTEYLDNELKKLGIYSGGANENQKGTNPTSMEAGWYTAHGGKGEGKVGQPEKGMGIGNGDATSNNRERQFENMRTDDAQEPMWENSKVTPYQANLDRSVAKPLSRREINKKSINNMYTNAMPVKRKHVNTNLSEQTVISFGTSTLIPQKKSLPVAGIKEKSSTQADIVILSDGDSDGTAVKANDDKKSSKVVESDFGNIFSKNSILKGKMNKILQKHNVAEVKRMRSNEQKNAHIAPKKSHTAPKSSPVLTKSSPAVPNRSATFGTSNLSHITTIKTVKPSGLAVEAEKSIESLPSSQSSGTIKIRKFNTFRKEPQPVVFLGSSKSAKKLKLSYYSDKMDLDYSSDNGSKAKSREVILSLEKKTSEGLGDESSEEEEEEEEVEFEEILAGNTIGKKLGSDRDRIRARLEEIESRSRIIMKDDEPEVKTRSKHETKDESRKRKRVVALSDSEDELSVNIDKFKQLNETEAMIEDSEDSNEFVPEISDEKNESDVQQKKRGQREVDEISSSDVDSVIIDEEENLEDEYLEPAADDTRG
ncbi:hypothetical protein AX774_g6291, partial [Zancudomyces culisetae]